MPLDDYDQQFLDAGQRWNVDPRLLKTIADIESSGRPGASNRSGAAGLMGFMPPTAKQYGVDPRDAGSSIDGGAHYIHDLLTQYGGNVDTALHHYSGRTPGYTQEVAKRYGTFSLPAEPPPAPAEPGVKNFQTPARVPNTFVAEGKFPIWAQPQRVPQAGGTAPPPPEQPMPTKPQVDDPDLRDILAARPQSNPDAEAAALQEMLASRANPVPPPQPQPQPSAFAAMMDPALGQPAAPMLGMPALQQAGAGWFQGVRDVKTAAGRADDYLANRFPLYRELEKRTGSYDPEATPAREASTKAYEEQQQGNWVAPVGRFAANMAPTLPFGAPAAALGGAVKTALPYAGRVVGPMLEGGSMGAIGNLLTTTGKTPEEWTKDAATGFGIGGALGTVLGGGKAMLGVRASPADQALADRLNVRMSSGQTAGGPLKALEDVTEHMPGSGAGKFGGQQRQEIANVLARQMGEKEGAPITAASLGQAEDRIGTAIEKASGGVNIVGTPQLATEVQSIRDMAMMQGPTTNEAHAFNDLYSRLANIVQNNNGQIPGPEFQKFIARGGPLDNAIRSRNGDVSQIGSRLKAALVDAADAGGTGSQQAVADLRQARYQYKVLKTIEPTITRTGPGSEEMSYQGLAQRIRSNFNTGAGATGQGHEMADLSRLLSGPLRELKSSGTGRQMWYQDLLRHGIGPAAATGGFYAGMPILHSLGIAAAPLAIGATAGRALRYGIPGADATLNRLLPASVTNLLTDQRQYSARPAGQ